MTKLCQICNEVELHHHSQTVCEGCGKVYFKQKQQAISKLNHEVKKGTLTRPLICELCGIEPGFRESPVLIHAGQRSLIVGHHYNGHDKPLDVWWLCPRCNNKLPGPVCHSGKITKEQAREIILGKRQLMTDDEIKQIFEAKRIIKIKGRHLEAGLTLVFDDNSEVYIWAEPWYDGEMAYLQFEHEPKED